MSLEVFYRPMISIHFIDLICANLESLVRLMLFNQWLFIFICERAMATSTRKRNPNFFETELKILLKEVEKCKGVLFSKLSSDTTNNSKKRVWESICAKVNSCNSTGHKRNVEDIRKRMNNLHVGNKEKGRKTAKGDEKTWRRSATR